MNHGIHHSIARPFTPTYPAHTAPGESGRAWEDKDMVTGWVVSWPRSRVVHVIPRHVDTT